MAFEWTDLVDGKDYVTAKPINRIAHEVEELESKLENFNPDVGNAVLDLGNFYKDSFVGSQDVTDIITYKPAMMDIFTKTPPFKAISLSDDGSGVSAQETFYFDSQDWNYDNRYIEMRFVRSTALGDPKVLILTYYYEEDYKTVYQIIASIETDNRIGDIDTALDGIIAIQEALIGGDSV
jgi:hypothetical protein